MSLLKGRLFALFFACLLVVAAAFGVMYVNRSGERLQSFDGARLVNLHIEDVTLPRENAIPVEIMTGVAAHISCDRVTSPDEKGHTRFRFHLAGQVVERPDCTIDHTFEPMPDAQTSVKLEYLVTGPDGTERVVDAWVAPVKLVPQRKFVRLRALETADGKPLSTVTVPQYVLPYVDSVLKLPGEPKDFVALFFLRRFGRDELLLRVGVERGEAGPKLRPVTAAVKRHRRFGPELTGYVAWPAEPIAIGNPEDVREMFEIVTGIFPAAEADKLLARCCSAARPAEGVLVLNALPTEEVRALAVDGQLSEAIRVVRSAGATSTDSKVLTPPSAPSPVSGGLSPTPAPSPESTGLEPPSAPSPDSTGLEPPSAPAVPPTPAPPSDSSAGASSTP